MWQGSCLKVSFYGFIMFLASVTLNTTFLGILESIIPGTISLLWKVLICVSPGDAEISRCHGRHVWTVFPQHTQEQQTDSRD